MRRGRGRPGLAGEMSFCALLAAVLLPLAALSLAATQAVFDGKVRKTADGRYEAYLVPPAATNHASFLELLPSGDLLLTWFAGIAEGADNCSIVMARLPHKSDQWSNASLVSRRPGYSNQNPVLFLDPTGQVLYLFHSQQPANPSPHRSRPSHPPPPPLPSASSTESLANIWMLQSFDEGVNWTTPRDVFSKSGSFDRNRIIYSLSGDWIFPMYYSLEGDINQYSLVMISDDQHTWTPYPLSSSNYLVQPSIIRPEIGRPRLIAFMRDKRSKFIYTSTSVDDGYTWSNPMSSQFPNNDAAIQAHVLTNGHVILVYNPTTGPRVPLRVSLSQDGGANWPYSRDLESGNGTSVEYSYPCITQSRDDEYIHISYTYNRQTIKYVKFLESWITEQ